MQIQMGRVSRTDRYCSSPSQDHKWETIASGNKSEAIEQFIDFLNDRSSDDDFSIDNWWFRTKADKEVSK